MAIEDIRIEHIPGQSNFTEGLLGLTPVLKIAGTVNFSSTKSKPIKSIKLILVGTASCGLKLDTREPVEQSSVFLTRSADELIGLVKQADGSVAVKKGGNECTFEIVLSAEDMKGLPGSVEYVMSERSGENAVKGDFVRVEYSLAVQIETMGGFMSASKKLQEMEVVDIPRYNVPSLIRSQQTDTTVFISGATAPLEYRVTVSRGVFSLSQMVNFKVHHVHTIDPKATIKSVAVRIRQDTTITVKDRKKTVHTYLASAAGKFHQEEAKVKGGKVVWVGEGNATIDSTHVKKSNGLLAGSQVIDAFSGVKVEGLFEIQHFAELFVVMKEGKEFKFVTPVEFLAVDEETKEWMIQNATKLGVRFAEAEE
ncbi:hypothetical protein HDU78_005741 [Chytriomyces hyalinus]|nr:hypothetical protein HDU78_005741 [Chytriomyces hyalinus]KAJ3265004.1 hypothetical protein HDU77_006828 [Chytriomyces hyalinus]